MPSASWKTLSSAECASMECCGRCAALQVVSWPDDPGRQFRSTEGPSPTPGVYIYYLPLGGCCARCASCLLLAGAAVVHGMRAAPEQQHPLFRCLSKNPLFRCLSKNEVAAYGRPYPASAFAACGRDASLHGKHPCTLQASPPSLVASQDPHAHTLSPMPAPPPCNTQGPPNQSTPFLGSPLFAGSGNSKGDSRGWTHGWGDPYNTFWCCYGTAVESFSKLADSIYFHRY